MLSPRAQGQCCREGPSQPLPLFMASFHSAFTNPASEEVQFVNFTSQIWDAGFGDHGGYQHLRTTYCVL